MTRAIGFFVVLGLVLAAAAPAEAKTTRDLTYRQSQIWNSAIRFLRVDLKYPILEKDREAAYLLFEYREAGRGYAATLELVPAGTSARPIIKASLNIERMPSYVEEVLLDQFSRKLKSDYGEQPVLAPGDGTPKADGAGKGKGKNTDADKAKPATQDDDEAAEESPDDQVEQEPPE
jgi:hypothetical protein